MQIIYTKAKLKEQKTEFSYWQTQPYETRLAALEEIRHINGNITMLNPDFSE